MIWQYFTERTYLLSSRSLRESIFVFVVSTFSASAAEWDGFRVVINYFHLDYVINELSSVSPEPSLMVKKEECSGNILKFPRPRIDDPQSVMRNSQVRTEDLSFLVNKVQYPRIWSLWPVIFEIENFVGLIIESRFDNFKFLTEPINLIIPVLKNKIVKITAGQVQSFLTYIWITGSCM